MSQRERAEGCTQREISVAEALQRRLYLQREAVAEALKTVFAEGGVAEALKAELVEGGCRRGPEDCIRRGRVSQRERAEGCTQRGISAAEALKAVFTEGGVAGCT